jgi:ADP-ribose pyrophosphatase YjhB (NUDIX family)
MCPLDSPNAINHSRTQVGAFGDPGRDPRGWTVTVAYAALVPCKDQLGVKAAVSGSLHTHLHGLDAYNHSTRHAGCRVGCMW